MSTTYMRSDLYVWDVALANGDIRKLLAAQSPSGFTSPVTSAVRGVAYANGPPPAPSTLVPATAKLGDASFTLHVQGVSFRVGDVITWNGVAQPTTLVSATELTTSVDMTKQTTALPIPVTVRALSGAASDPLTFDLRLT